MFRRVPITMLSEGLILASAIHDENLRLLLGAGIPITTDLIAGLIGRNVQTVVVAEKDWVRLSAFKSAANPRRRSPNGGGRPRASKRLRAANSTEWLAISARAKFVLPTTRSTPRSNRAGPCATNGP